MKDDNLYNLMTQLTQEAKSLWRIQGDYIDDAIENKSLMKFWEALVDEKKKTVNKLKAKIKSEMNKK